MKVFVILSALLVAVSAAPAGVFYPFAPTTYLATAPLATKYHAQDSLGQYNYGYNDGLSSKQEVRTFDGITRGSYSYVDAKGELQTVDYTSDSLNGFRVAGTNLPKALPVPEVKLPEPVAETPEVAAARAEHLAALKKATDESAPMMMMPEKSSKPLPELVKAEMDSIMVEAPKPVELAKPVEDTPEVMAARKAHLEAHKEAELREKIIEKSESTVIEAAPIVAEAAPIVHAASILASAKIVAPAPIVASAPIVQAAGIVVPNFRFSYSVQEPLTYSYRY